MKTIALTVAAMAFCGLVAGAGEKNDVMSEAYWRIWNPDVQARIDRDIERNRKADAVLKLKGAAAGSEVTVEQLSHDFVFGANIFNFNQLGSPERNRRYKELFGTLFNSATIAFYWKTFEMEPGKPRFKEAPRDTEAYWNRVEKPKEAPHWRRPASDPVVAFCEQKGIRRHGHPMVWGNRTWHHPAWMFETCCPAAEKEKIQALGKKGLSGLSPAAIAERAPVYTREMRRRFEKRVQELCEHYGDRLQSWDVVNESATDFGRGSMVPGERICKSHYGLMPGDYAYWGFKQADRGLPKNVLLNINDYANNQAYADQVKDLMARGCRIDVMGSQMHLFKPRQCLDIAAGKPIETPEIVWKKMKTIGRAGLPIHLSEITITSPGDDPRGREIQAVIAGNLYRLWFSIKPMMGITWWNIVDDCGAPGEPTISGLFTRDMQPKPSFHALDRLINHAWKTRLALKAGPDGAVTFRGFRGRYRVSWTDATGKKQQAEFELKQDGDGL
jgi:GH35 family endo-1,4-beta-xylanase